MITIYWRVFVASSLSITLPTTGCSYLLLANDVEIFYSELLRYSVDLVSHLYDVWGKKRCDFFVCTILFCGSNLFTNRPLETTTLSLVVQKNTVSMDSIAGNWNVGGNCI